MKIYNQIIGFTLLAVSRLVFADFEEGLDAANRGDFKTAIFEWQPIAEKGNASAQYNLGLIHSNGNGVPQDDIEAVKWFRLSAEQGYAAAQYMLGQAYFFGRGELQDFKEAYKWYRLASEQGIAEAQIRLALMLADGDGGQKNTKESIKWLRLAAEQGNPDGQFFLGTTYFLGTTIPQDYKAALKWYRLSAEQGNAEALGSLASLYYNGEGVQQNSVVAYALANLAAPSGGEYQNGLRNHILKELNSSEIKYAQELTNKLRNNSLSEIDNYLLEEKINNSAILPIKINDEIDIDTIFLISDCRSVYQSNGETVKYEWAKNEFNLNYNNLLHKYNKETLDDEHWKMSTRMKNQKNNYAATLNEQCQFLYERRMYIWGDG